MLGMSLSCSLRQTQTLAQSLRLSQEQRLSLIQGQLTLRLSLIEELRGDRYDPRGTCPQCGRKLTGAEIISGFNQDPRDFTTRCSGCNYRFEPRLVCFSKNGASQIELPFYCDCQTLDQLRGKENLSPEELSAKHPAIYRSAIVHHGGIKSAFLKIGIAYSFEEIVDWKNKIKGFLGRLPDKVIAECVNVSARVIGKIRRELKISRYTLSKALEEAA